MLLELENARATAILSAQITVNTALIYYLAAKAGDTEELRELFNILPDMPTFTQSEHFKTLVEDVIKEAKLAIQTMKEDMNT